MISTLILITYTIICVISIFKTINHLQFSSTQFNETNEFHKVSIIIPTKNEEKNIGRLLESLTNQDYPDFEIIVVDGQSTDKTREVVNSFNKVKLIDEPVRPSNWIGKPWACFNGYQCAKGDILLFTDADTYHDPQTLQRSVSVLECSNGFVSMITRQKYGSFWERMLTIVFLLITTSVNGVERESGTRMANGQFMMFRREIYERIGGHVSVSGSIIEDLELGSIANQKGYPPVIINGQNLVEVRMYESFADIREGFSKNLALGLTKVGRSGFVDTFLMTIWAMGGPVLLIFAFIGIIPKNLTLQTVILIGYLLFVLLFVLSEKFLTGKYSTFAIIYPLFFLSFWYIFIHSIYQLHFENKIHWKGNIYRVNQR